MAKKKTKTCNLFESLASDTWHRLRVCRQMKFSLLETSITDLLLVELKRANLPGLRVIKATADKEKQYGYDWEWYLMRPGGWYRFAVQAKKLFPETESYKSLNYPKYSKKNGKTVKKQIDALDEFSRINPSVIPLYCFYNYVASIPKPKSIWSCKGPFDGPQLGCTLSPLSSVYPQAQPGKWKRFHSLHDQTKGRKAYPWRCLFCCDASCSGSCQGLAPASYKPKKSLPEYLRTPQLDREAASVIPIESLPDRDYSPEIAGYPRRILVLDTSR